MEEKYLPIGTVCTIKNSNKKVMIMSYFSIEYNNSAVMYDYKGCVYPEGLLLPSQAVSFNHDDIVSVDFLGYKNNDFEVFNNNLNRKNETAPVETDQAVIKNFQFDENGVVIFDPTVPQKETVEPIKEEKIENPFQVTETVTKEANTENNVFNGKYKFDENGVVIEDNNVTTNTNASAYTFDENGFVVSDNTVAKKEETPSTDTKYKFDENGVVIGEN